MEECSSKKRAWDDSDEFLFDSPAVKRIREDLLENSDDWEIYATSNDLDSFMKSFAEEISPATKQSEPVTDLTSESGESLPELGYLLEASDDELGLPSSSKEAEEEKVELGRVESDSAELDGGGGFWGFDEEFSGFHSFDFGADASCGNDYVILDGLFEYADPGPASRVLGFHMET